MNFDCKVCEKCSSPMTAQVYASHVCGDSATISDQKRYKRFGRLKGSQNYGATISFIAQQFKREGYDWRHELIESYRTYKTQYDAWLADPVRPKPDSMLLDFWTRMMPYIALTVSEKDAHRKARAVRRSSKGPKISRAALDRLAEAEGRPQ